ncbi:MAG: FAD-dependent oxidoreductase [Anaerolineae bacterium]|mgnify:CR=1 FL=1|jgi:formate dehydrogenase (NADP+) beta subunit|nr:FAD-dependent oxidoreductase [Anaerolineae bacterium]MBT7191803.1 FAD-dependent oxidoreductase [Anaerolineae bacterium]MBT7991973.1 FAD-dependent oxidoreductase [Anaerolineae bacterium]
MNKKFQVKIPNIDDWRDMIKCQAGCPVNTDSRGYVTAMARGEIGLGFEISHDPNPLSTICGRICGAPCEVACRRSDIVGPDAKPVAIRPIKRVLTERFGPEAGKIVPDRAGSEKLIPLADILPDTGLSTFSANLHRVGKKATVPGTGTSFPYSTVRWSRKELMRLASQPGRKKGNVAIIGAGPASLTVAHDLTLLRYKVTIYEAGPKTGGMLRYGVPVYRIDQEAMDLEIQEILDLGVEIHFDTPIGEKITLDDLRRDYDAVFLGIGLMKGRSLDIEGSDLDGVIIAVDMLLNYNLGYKVDLGKRVLVIGGGDVAMDAARTALRLGQLTDEQQAALDDTEARAEEESETVSTALDVARVALRLGVADVKMISLEDWDELPASDFEVEEALEEGIQLSPRVGPKRIIGEDGKVSGLEVIDVESVFDEDGRFSPKFKTDSERIWDCDTVILAIGQQADLDVLGGADDVKLSSRGLVEINYETGQTTAPDVFAGGDVAYGPKLIIDAVRHGHLAALGIEEYLQAKKLDMEVKTEWTVLANHVMFENWVKLKNHKSPNLPVGRRTGISVVELGYTEEEAAEQGSRCLECSVNTIFDGSLCILCNGCVDVCPWDCLKIVSLDKIAGDETLHRVIEEHTGVPLNEITENHNITSQMAAMLKDDESCTRCALCADRCPTDAITMEAFRFEEVLSFVDKK